MLEKLGAVLKKATDKIANAIFLDKNLVDSIVKDLQRALIEADVNIQLVKQISDKLKKVAYDERIKGIEKKEHLIKVLHDELLNILGEKKPLQLQTSSQNRILLLGLYGAGKTTTIAKLGNYFSKRGNKVAVVGLDVHRPAAKEQLKQLAEKNNLNCFLDFEENDAVKTWKKLKNDLKKYNVVLIDTAGRHTLDEELKPKAFLSRLLGMGDLETLMEKIKSIEDKNKQKKIQKSIEAGKLSLEDVIEQVKSMKSLG